jgi:hypothetical protein
MSTVVGYRVKLVKLSQNKRVTDLDRKGDIVINTSFLLVHMSEEKDMNMIIVNYGRL